MSENTARIAPLPHPLRKPCGDCGSAIGRIRETGSQDCVYCIGCQKFQYNAPRAETGKPVRTVRNGRDVDISPGLRAEILIVRANGRCELCGTTPATGIELQVGHLLSVDAGKKLGLSDEDLYDPDNLCAMCATCNLGLGAQPVSLRLVVALTMARINRMKAKLPK